MANPLLPLNALLPAFRRPAEGKMRMGVREEEGQESRTVY